MGQFKPVRPPENDIKIFRTFSRAFKWHIYMPDMVQFGAEEAAIAMLFLFLFFSFVLQCTHGLSKRKAIKCRDVITWPCSRHSFVNASFESCSASKEGDAWMMTMSCAVTSRKTIEQFPDSRTRTDIIFSAGVKYNNDPGVINPSSRPYISFFSAVYLMNIIRSFPYKLIRILCGRFITDGRRLHKQ